MQKQLLKKLTNSAFILGALYMGAINFSPASAQLTCDQSQIQPHCLAPAAAKISNCPTGPENEQCINRWHIAQSKCVCDLGCPELAPTFPGGVTCEAARAFCESDIASNRCDDLHR
jgi:hypothetical protein